MRQIKLILFVVSLLFLTSSLQSRDVLEENFFGKKITRRYYPEEYSFIKNQSAVLPIKNTLLPLKYLKYSASPSLKPVSITQGKERIKVENFGVDDNAVIHLQFNRENFRQGALALNLKSELPAWSKCLSLWIFDTLSGMDAYLYLKTSQGKKRYSIGKLNHSGWKNFLVKIEKDDNPILLYQVKFFNRKKVGGANDYEPIIKISSLECFSEILSKRPLYFSLKNLSGNNFKKNFIPSRKKYAYLLNKGLFFPSQDILSIFITVRTPLYLEIIGSLVQHKSRLFLLQTPIIQLPGIYRLDIRFPEEIKQYFSYQGQKGNIFWGMQVFSADNDRQADFEINRVQFWEDLRIQ